MFKLIIDIFCKDTIIGLCAFENIKGNRIYKNRQYRLFLKNNNEKNYLSFTDPFDYHL